MIKWLLCILSMIFLTNCSHMGVEPWERDLLSEPEMTFGSESVQQAYEQHTYFSKEATSGGSGFSGGGCGCN